MLKKYINNKNEFKNKKQYIYIIILNKIYIEKNYYIFV